ncbi:MAG: molybdopterin-binding protein [Dehalococcoidales bacterium]|jgi:molybdopterin molybdotransferase/putative molybdopterin biosynthesis protein
MSNKHIPTYNNLPSREEIIKRITDNWKIKRETEIIPVDVAMNRIPSADVLAGVTLPMVRASGGDGVAVASSRFLHGIPDTSSWIPGRDFVRADTGDDFDDAFDAVIMIEDVDISKDGKLTIHEGIQVTPGKNVRPTGSTITAGDPIIKAYLPLRPKDLAGLQMGGVQKIEVLKKPTVAFIPSGDELIAPGTPVSRGKNIDTNSLLVRETLRQFGAEPWCFPIVRDDDESLEQALTGALKQSDIVVISGGSSKGDEDCTATLLHRRGQVLCHGSQAVPGKPLCAAMVEGKPVINLPGPFIAAYHGLEWCINYLVSYYLKQPKQQRQTVKATLTRELRGSDMVSMLVMVEVTRKKDGAGFWATPYSIREIPMWRCIASNAQYMTKLNEYVTRGGEIEVELLRGLAYIPISDE